MADIKLKSLAEVAVIRQACQIVARALEEMARQVKPGVTTGDLDNFAEKLIREAGAEPVFIGYRGYRHATCISVNEEIVHGIPGSRVLQEGDIVSLDVGSRYHGYCGDTAATVAVGKINAKAARLLRTTKEALRAAIRQAQPGKHLGDISAAIQRVAEAKGYSVVRELYGHGVGVELHEDPLVPNFGRIGEGPLLKAGMVLAVEPMLNVGTWRIKTLNDGWTVVTTDRQLSCHFEHTIFINESGPEILTKRTTDG
ncbi:type I methionyl aminopeptidase [Candidatus Saganbacteria bacterium]|nr:type I methionyl aminopeptidase [Candidatus Saganbacteria bacterium]